MKPSSVTRLRAWRLALSGPIFFSYFSLFYLTLLLPDRVLPQTVLLLIVALISYLANGFLLNDLADRENDIASEGARPARGHLLSRAQMASLVAATFVVGVAAVALLQGGYVFDVLWIFAYASSVLYSVPPFALKRRGAMGVICDSLIERPLPILIIFSYFGYFGFEIILFPVLSELSWSVFRHQVADIELDAKAKVGTSAVKLGKERSYKLLSYVLNPTSAIAQYLLLVVAYIRLPLARDGILLVSVAMAAGIALSVALEKRIRLRATPTDPPYIMFVNFAYKLLVLPMMAIYVLSTRPELFFFGLLLLISLIPHLKDYSVLIPKVYQELSIPKRK